MALKPVIAGQGFYNERPGGSSAPSGTGLVSVTSGVYDAPSTLEARLIAYFVTLPTSDPHVVGSPYVNGGFLMVSEG